MEEADEAQRIVDETTGSINNDGDDARTNASPIDDNDDPTPVPDTTATIQNALMTLLGNSVSSKGTDVRSPDKFTGVDRTKFRTYIAQCRLVFRANPVKFNTDTKQVTYACSYLDGLAFQWYQNALELDEDPLWFDNWNLFKNELQSQFGEVNIEATAERNIRTLNMKTSDNITTYITKFHTLANNLQWNNEALVSEFRQGLAGRIKDELQHVERDHWTLNDLEARCLKIDYRYWERQNERGSETHEPRIVQKTTTTHQQTTNFRNRDPRSNDPRPPRSNVEKTTTISTNLPPLPLDKTGHVTSAERQRRIDKGLCHYCGGSHKIDDCPKKKDTGNYQRANTRMATATFAIQGNE